MRRLRAETLRPKHFGSQVLCEFLRCAVHTSLWALKVYPSETFKLQQSLESLIWINRAPCLNQYIDHAIDSIQEMLTTAALASLELLIWRVKARQVTHSQSLLFKIPQYPPSLDPFEFVGNCHRGTRYALDKLTRLLPFECPSLDQETESHFVLRSHARVPICPATFRSERHGDVNAAKEISADLGASIHVIRRFLCNWISHENQACSPRTPVTAEEKMVEKVEASPEKHLVSLRAGSDPVSMLNVTIVSQDSPAEM